ncbi:hypothetical protein GCM10009743_23560 [Kribbella swartbergensis]
MQPEFERRVDPSEAPYAAGNIGPHLAMRLVTEKTNLYNTFLVASMPFGLLAASCQVQPGLVGGAVRS